MVKSADLESVPIFQIVLRHNRETITKPKTVKDAQFYVNKNH